MVLPYEVAAHAFLICGIGGIHDFSSIDDGLVVCSELGVRHVVLYIAAPVPGRKGRSRSGDRNGMSSYHGEAFTDWIQSGQ